jgi:hypothetical protein
VREKLDAWLRDGGTIRIVPFSAFLVAVLLGIIPMWLEFGAFPAWAPRERVGAPLLVGWIAVFLAAEVVRRFLVNRGARRWEDQLRRSELERADQLAGAIDRICASLVPDADGRLAPDHIQASLLQGMADAARVAANLDPAVRLHASLMIPVLRREGRRQRRYLQIASTSRLVEGRGWAAFRVDAKGPAQDTYTDGRPRAVPDTAAESVRGLFRGGSYRSIVTLPVTLRCMRGKRLAVVSVDASEPGVFTDELVHLGLEQAVAPYIKLIALTLALPGGTTGGGSS